MSDSLYPSNIQCVLMLDHRNVVNLAQIVDKFLQIEAMKSGTKYNLVERNGNIYFRLFSTNNIMITLEYIDGPAQINVLVPSLKSAFTQLTIPNAFEILKNSKSHVLINVHHGALTPGLMGDFMEKIGMEPEGHSLQHFRERLKLCGMLSSLVNDMGQASLVHWTQSDLLFRGNVFETIAMQDAPSPLHIHPLPYRAADSADGKPQVELKTFGAAHFLGREVTVKPTAVPWTSALEQVFVFLRLALVDNGYVIPDGETFGPKDHSKSCRVRHIAEQNTGERKIPATYELEILLDGDNDFVSPSYTPRDRIINPKDPPADVLNEKSAKGQKIMEGWDKSRQMSEAIGGSFEVRVKEKPNQPRTLFGVNGIFGRRQ